MKCKTFLGAAAALFVSASPAAAADLIDVNDLGDIFNTSQLQESYYALHWSQTVAATAVQAEAALSGRGETKWWLTNQLGPGTTNANVVTSGKFDLAQIIFTNDFDLEPQTTIFSGVNLAAGDYYLVIASPNSNTEGWDWDFSTSVALSPGFTLVDGYLKGDFHSGDGPLPPDQPFTAFAERRLGFRLQGTVAGAASAPEPATWALMIGGFGLAGAALRRRRARPT